MNGPGVTAAAPRQHSSEGCGRGDEAALHGGAKISSPLAAPPP